MSNLQRRYHLVEALGRDDFGDLYKAEVAGEGAVALWLLQPNCAERRAAAAAVGPQRGLWSARAVELEGRPALVLDWFDGVGLEALLAAGPVPPAVALELVDALASGLAAIGENGGPSHGAIAPALIRLGLDGQPRLRGHGLGAGDGEAADVWALGAVLGGLVVGAPLHGGGVGAGLPAEAAAALAQGDVEEGLRELILDCLHPDARQRPTAAELVRRCRGARARHRVPALRDWAPAALAAVARPPLADPLVGAVLSDAPAPLDPPAADRLPHLLIGGLSAVISAMVVVLVGLLVYAVLLPRTVAPAATVEAPAPEAPAPVEAPPAEAVPVEAAEEVPAPVTPAPPAPSHPPQATPPKVAPPPPAEVEDPEPAEEPEEPPPPPPPHSDLVRVGVTGDAASVSLSGDAGTFVLPAAVPPGSYLIRAAFGEDPVNAGTVTVSPDQPLTLSCRGGLKRCTAR